MRQSVQACLPDGGHCGVGFVAVHHEGGQILQCWGEVLLCCQFSHHCVVQLVFWHGVWLQRCV